jgi:protein O-mannosyl-transferase
MSMKNKLGFVKPVVLIIALTAIVYANSLKNHFVGDDAGIIVNNSFIKNWKNLPLVFSRDYLTSLKDLGFLGMRNVGSGELYYRPVVTLSYFIDYHLWGLNPFGYHLTNLSLHIANALLLFYMANLIVVSAPIALSAALLFALHPVNTEAVNAVFFREDLLAFLFFVSALIFYILAGRQGGIRKIYAYSASLGLFFVALFSKEMAATLPFILLLYDHYFIDRPKQRNLSTVFKFRHLGYFAILVIYLWLWGVVFKNPNPLPKYPGGSLYTNFLTMSTVVAGYIKLLVMPVPVHFMVTQPQTTVWHFTPAVLASTVLIAACLFAAIKTYRSAKEISFSIAWFFITLLPVSNIFPIRYIVGLRYLYIPIAGFCLFLPLLLLRLRGLKSAIAVILLFYFVLTISANRAWQDNVSLWSQVVKWYPNNHFARYGLGEVLLKNGDTDKAMEEFRASLKLNPGNIQARNLLAGYYADKGRLEAAIAEYKKALEFDPKCLEAYNNLAALYAQTGRIKEAIALWEAAVKLDPQFLTAHFNLAVFYYQAGQYDLAIKHSDAVVKYGGQIDHKFMELLKPHRK